LPDGRDAAFRWRWLGFINVNARAFFNWLCYLSTRRDLCTAICADHQNTPV